MKNKIILIIIILIVVLVASYAVFKNHKSGIQHNGTSLPHNFPKTLILDTNSSLQSSKVSNLAHSTAEVVTFSSNKSVSDLYNQYTSYFNANGYKITQNALIPEKEPTTAIINATNAKQDTAVNISELNGKVSVTINYLIKQ